MNNVIILGGVIDVSKLHFDYADKLKAYFNILIDDYSGNVFKVVIK